jgi:small subunit ribosomal protein S6
MRRYETIVIIDPDLGEDDRASMSTRIKEIIPQHEGVFLQEDLWGARKLAYAIKNKPRGYFARYDYCGMGPLVDELERSLRIDDRVLKYLTVQLEEDADADKILAELAAAQSAAETASASEEPVKKDSLETPTEQTPAEAPAKETAAEAPTEDTTASTEERAEATAESNAAEPATETSGKE